MSLWFSKIVLYFFEQNKNFYLWMKTMNIEQYLKDKLNEEQYRAALHAGTSSLILAGAGSGKTRTLTYKIAYLIFGQQVAAKRIMAVTFTNKAANEMKQRVVEIAHQIQADGVTDKTIYLHPQRDFFWLGTFHSLFLKFLKEEIENANFWYTKNFWVYDENETQSVIKDILKQLKMDQDVEVKEAKWFISKLKWQGLTYEKYKKMVNWDYEQTMAMIYELYEKNLRQSNAMDFDDLLLLPYWVMKDHPEIAARWQARFDYVMVDEAQDTNWIQFELVKLVAGGQGNVTFIWDDYQSIYRRRWALMENFLNLKKIWSDMEIFKLETNYRSKPHIVHAGSHIIKNNTKQYEKNIKAHREWDDAIKVFAYTDETAEALYTIDMIKKMQKEWLVTRWDVAILYRTNAQSAPFEQVLIQEGIPYKVRWGFKFFERKEIKDVISYYKYIINPRDSVSLKRIINVPKRKIWADTITKLEEYALQNDMALTDVIDGIDHLPLPLGSGTQTAIKQFAITMKFLKNNMENLKPAALIQQIVSTIKYKEYLVVAEGQEIGEEKYDNVWQLINMAQRYDNWATDSELLQSGSQLHQQFLQEIALMTDIEENQDGSIDVVKLMSVHSSKWLEFPLVFLVGVEENLFPLQKAQFEKDEMEEERRLMYVAITRAKDHLFISYAGSRKQRWQQKYNAPSRFVEELPENLKTLYSLGNGTVAGNFAAAFSEEDRVIHKLFGAGTVVEVWKDVAIVKFDKPQYGVRKIEARFLSKE